MPVSRRQLLLGAGGVLAAGAGCVPLTTLIPAAPVALEWLAAASLAEGVVISTGMIAAALGDFFSGVVGDPDVDVEPRIATPAERESMGGISCEMPPVVVNRRPDLLIWISEPVSEFVMVARVGEPPQAIARAFVDVLLQDPRIEPVGSTALGQCAACGQALFTQAIALGPAAGLMTADPAGALPHRCTVTATTSSPGAAPTHTVRHGETLISIARSDLGDPALWREILKMNPGIHPRRLQPGSVLQLPPR